jgi:hypothetical protein
MTRRSESYFASTALVVLLALVLFYGCRAFDPEPVVVNSPPETFIPGAPAETTGTRFLRHLYWYGTDSDGEVVRFIYAITDSSVQDHETLDEDEEDALFDPADDVTTLVPNEERRIGYTTKTDSIFLFQIDRGSTPSKDITFHIVAVDDRGRMDPTPARLHFFDNSLGNPTLEFTVYTWETLSDGSQDWVKRWIGSPTGPAIGRSPELTETPVVGFSRRFKIEWVASSPNGAIDGYRFLAGQGTNAAYTPPDDAQGESQWSPAATSFTYLNDVPPANFPACELDPLTGQILEASVCPPDSVRWPSDDYRVSVEALDIALVESEESAGILRFSVNYAPETTLTDDATWPLYRVADGIGGFSEFAISPTDTVPMDSYAVFQFTGFDKTESLATPPASYTELCCDVIESDDRVSFQARYEAIMDKGRFTAKLLTRLSDPFRRSAAPGDIDTIGFNVGPFAYTVFGVARDEHGRVDRSPEEFRFVAGFQPRLLSVVPDTGDSLIFTNPNLPRWPNSLDYVQSSATRWWTGRDFVNDAAKCPDSGNCVSTSGTLYQFQAHFRAAPHPAEPTQAVRAWQFRYFTDNDPINRLSDGLESKDFSTWAAKSSTPNQWLFNLSNEAITLFVPAIFWFVPAFYEPSSGDVAQRGQGEWMVKRLGEALLELRGRNSAPGDRWPIYQGVRPPIDELPVDIQEGGRRTAFKSVRWSIYLGIDTDSDGQADRFWPDFPLSDYEQ